MTGHLKCTPKVQYNHSAALCILTAVFWRGEKRVLVSLLFSSPLDRHDDPGWFMRVHDEGEKVAVCEAHVAVAGVSTGESQHMCRSSPPPPLHVGFSVRGLTGRGTLVAWNRRVSSSSLHGLLAALLLRSTSKGPFDVTLFKRLEIVVSWRNFQ